jgi:hypothetical protein
MQELYQTYLLDLNNEELGYEMMRSLFNPENLET